MEIFYQHWHDFRIEPPTSSGETGFRVGYFSGLVMRNEDRPQAVSDELKKELIPRLDEILEILKKTGWGGVSKLTFF